MNISAANCSLFTVQLSFFSAETLVYRLDEHIGGPETGCRAVYRIVVARGFRGLHLFQRHTLLDHVLNAVSNDRDHVTILDDIGFITQAAVTRNHHRPSFLLLCRNREVEDEIQRVNHAVNAATALQVDDRIACCHENVAAADDNRAAKEHDAVPIGVRGVRVKQLNGFAVKENFFFIAKVRVGRPRTRGAWSCGTGRRAHPFHHIFMREERRAFRCIGDVACDITAGNGGTGSSQLFVSSAVVRMKMRVDDVSNRPVGDRFRKLLHRGKYLIRHLGSARIHQQDAVLAGLHGDVAARPDEHVDVSLDVQHMNFGILLCVSETRSKNQRKDGIECLSDSRPHRALQRPRILKSDESCISYPKSEIANWTLRAVRSNSIFRNFGSEMHDLSDFKMSLANCFSLISNVTSRLHAFLTDIPDTSSRHHRVLRPPVRRASLEIYSETCWFQANDGALFPSAARLRRLRHTAMAIFAGADPGPSLSCG